MFSACVAKAQVNLPITKSASSRFNQERKLLDERYQGKLRDETSNILDDATRKHIADSLEADKKFDLERLKAQESEKARFPYRAQIAGLGNFAASQSGSQISPSANIFATVLPYNSPNLKLNFLFNIGVNTDSSNIDSVKLGTIFFPDKSRVGFGLRVSYDLFPLIKNRFKSEDISFDTDNDGYIIRDNLEPYVEYNYSKINFRNTNADSSNLQTSTLLVGLAYTHSWEKGDNTIGFIITPYFRSVKVTDGTYTLYKKMFDPVVKDQNSPQSVKFLGINTSLQVNRFLFSFIYESLKTKALSNTPLDGGVFTVKATVSGDFIKL